VTLTGVVLAGGASSRMGTDKALVEVDGVAMAVRVASALAGGGCEPVVCQGGDSRALGALGLTVSADTRPGEGPVAGILDALSAAGGDVVVCACDLPWFDAATVRDLVAAADAHPEAGVTVACDAAGPHLAGVWRSSTRERLAALFADGIRSYRSALEQLAARHVDVATNVVANINTPGDLRRHR